MLPASQPWTIVSQNGMVAGIAWWQNVFGGDSGLF
jgi:hypothetical protein